METGTPIPNPAAPTCVRKRRREVRSTSIIIPCASVDIPSPDMHDPSRCPRNRTFLDMSQQATERARAIDFLVAEKGQPAARQSPATTSVRYPFGRVRGAATAVASLRANVAGSTCIFEASDGFGKDLLRQPKHDLRKEDDERDRDQEHAIDRQRRAQGLRKSHPHEL